MGITVKKEILIYEKNKETLNFLKAFFKGRGEYSTHFIERGFKKELSKRNPTALIISSPQGLKNMKPLEINPVELQL